MDALAPACHAQPSGGTTMMATDARPFRKAKIIQRASGALLCTGCGALAPAPHFPCEVGDWKARVEAFVGQHETCGRAGE